MSDNPDTKAVLEREAVGNAAAMREALEKCRALAETIWQSEGGEDVSAEIAELKDRIDAALASPPRNCDVGSVQEQRKRFDNFCKKGKLERMALSAYCAYDCPCGRSFDCKLTWAQMPYEVGL